MKVNINIITFIVTDTLGSYHANCFGTISEQYLIVLSAHFYSSELLFNHAKKYLLNGSLLKASYTFGMLTKG